MHLLRTHSSTRKAHLNTMHGTRNIKTVNAQQERTKYNFNDVAGNLVHLLCIIPVHVRLLLLVGLSTLATLYTCFAARFSQSRTIVSLHKIHPLVIIMAEIRVLCEVRNGYVHVRLVHEPLIISTENFDNSRLQLPFPDNPSVQSFICNTVLEVYY